MNWTLNRIKDISKTNESSLSNNTDKAYLFKYIDIGNVSQNGIIEEPELVTFEDSPSRARRIVKKNDVIISTVRTYLKAITHFEDEIKNTIVSTGFAVLTPNKKVNFKYLAFKVLSESFVDSIISNSKGVSYPAINASEIECLDIVLPSLPEQIAIANYLDHKTKAIDQKVTLLTNKTEKYKELRKSLINQTVTKGLDKNTIWKTHRLKDIGQIYSGLSGKSGDDFKKDKDPNNRSFIPFTNIANNTYLDVGHLGKVIISPTEKQNKVQKNDLFFLMSSEGYEDIGKSAVLIENLPETYLNSFCKGFRITKTNVDALFINYLLLSDDNRNKMVIQGKGFTRINLKIEKVNNFSITIPSTKAEQTAIANYLDEKTSKIDAIVSNIANQIITLKELRKTLINDVVTGKIKVVK